MMCFSKGMAAATVRIWAAARSRVARCSSAPGCYGRPVLYRGQGSAARDSGFAASSSGRRKTAPRQSLPCAKGGGSKTRRDCVFILPFSTSLVRRRRRAFFCYFRLPESNQRAPGAPEAPPGPRRGCGLFPLRPRRCGACEVQPRPEVMKACFFDWRHRHKAGNFAEAARRQSLPYANSESSLRLQQRTLRKLPVRRLLTWSML